MYFKHSLNLMQPSIHAIRVTFIYVDLLQFPIAISYILLLFLILSYHFGFYVFSDRYIACLYNIYIPFFIKTPVLAASPDSYPIYLYFSKSLHFLFFIESFLLYSKYYVKYTRVSSTSVFSILIYQILVCITFFVSDPHIFF